MRATSIAVIVVLSAATAGAEPVIDLRIGPTRFAAGASVLVPTALTEPLNIWLEDTLAVVEVSSVRVQLNGNAMTAFTNVNRLPRGVRAIVKLGLSLGADFTLRPGVENVLTFAALDETKTAYNATFYVTPDSQSAVPRLAPLQRVGRREVTAPPPTVGKPAIQLETEVPASSGGQSLDIAAVVTDAEGLRRIAVEVNGNISDEVLLQNGYPVRRRNGRTTTGGAPGVVQGDGTKVVLRVPVRLKRDAVNVVTIKAENISGIVERLDRTVKTDR